MRSLFILTIVFLSNAMLLAQDTSRVTLVQLLQKVEKDFPAILKYQQASLALKARAGSAKAWMPPTFSAGLMRWPYQLSMLRDESPMNQAGLAFTLEQMIPNGARLDARKSFMESLAETEEAKAGWTKNEYRREARQLYYRRVIAEKKLTALSSGLGLLELLVETATSRLSNNQAELQTIYKAKARIAELRNMMLMQEGVIAESNVGINTLMMRDVNTPFAIDTAFVPVQHTLSELNNADVSQRSDIQAMSRSIRSMKLESELMRAGKRPDFGVRAEHMKMFGMPDQWSVMGMITLPMVPWASRMYHSETRATDLQAGALELERQTMELMASRMRTEKLLMLNYQTSQYENFRKEVIPAFEKNLQVSLLAYRQDSGDFFVLLDAWEMLIMKKLELYDKLMEVMRLEAEYDYEMERG